MKGFDYKKEQYRGTVKQLMKVRGIRKICIENYFKWLGEKNTTGVHSLKIDLQDGYVNIYGRNENGRCGQIIQDASAEVYGLANDAVLAIFENEDSIKPEVRRNILVTTGR